MCMTWQDPFVLPEPNTDCDLGLSCGVEPLRVEHFPHQCSVETFVMSVLPRIARKELQRLDSDLLQPMLEAFGDEFGP